MGAIRWVVVIMLLSGCGASSTAPRSGMVCQPSLTLRL
jgi:hypothetical protein